MPQTFSLYSRTVDKRELNSSKLFTGALASKIAHASRMFPVHSEGGGYPRQLLKASNGFEEERYRAAATSPSICNHQRNWYALEVKTITKQQIDTSSPSRRNLPTHLRAPV